MTTAMADVGTRYNRIEAALSSLALRTDNLTASLSEVEDVDMARSIYDLNVAQVSYQAALGATAKVIQPSLMDFLR
jgi:flagellar hook-associated protein 3 FlgL